MKRLVIPFVVVLLALPVGARAEARFQRPDCPAPDAPLKAESRCIRDIKKRWRDENFAALQKTGLMFIYMARPDADSSPAAKEAVEKKIEGSFSVNFDVAKDGTVYNVRTLNVTDGIEPLAKLWADTIGQWTFTKIDEPVADIEFRRIYLYPREDETKSPQDSQNTH